jgi:hypothetical protein
MSVALFVIMTIFDSIWDIVYLYKLRAFAKTIQKTVEKITYFFVLMLSILLSLLVFAIWGIFSFFVFRDVNIGGSYQILGSSMSIALTISSDAAFAFKVFLIATSFVFSLRVLNRISEWRSEQIEFKIQTDEASSSVILKDRIRRRMSFLTVKIVSIMLFVAFLFFVPNHNLLQWICSLEKIVSIMTAFTSRRSENLDSLVEPLLYLGGIAIAANIWSLVDNHSFFFPKIPTFALTRSTKDAPQE